MKKIKKLNLQIDKEVISSLSNDEMNSVKGGEIIHTMQEGCTTTNSVVCETATCHTNTGTSLPCPTVNQTFKPAQCYGGTNTNQTSVGAGLCHIDCGTPVDKIIYSFHICYFTEYNSNCEGCN